ncbi:MULTISPECIES: BrnA antitoxin family protein [unclassified Sinorhizobium]|uniref:BrnA antitoxin family protein n=1 Tax=unclassified Sinorhizobium TaxID=2613772 RepID=UPI00352400D8
MDSASKKCASMTKTIKHKRRYRSPTGEPKTMISIRLDNDIVEAFRAKGYGWQSAINNILRKASGLSS